MSSLHPKVILDKCFIQAEGQDCPRLKALHRAGAIFVLADTLIYELCTDERKTFWPSVQRKLFHFADSIEVWDHIGPLLYREIRDQHPLTDPVNHGLTQQVRDWFRSGVEHVPHDLQKMAADYQKEREQRNVCALIIECRSFCTNNLQMTQEVQRDKKLGAQRVADLVGDAQRLTDNIRKNHGNAMDSELHIQGADMGLGPEWFAHHLQKGILALYGVFMLKYGLTNKPGKDFRNTKLDSDYAVLLHYADALATNETAGSLSDMCKWMYGKSRMRLSTQDVRQALSSEDEIRRSAYYRWQDCGRPEGLDQDHWFWAEAHLTSKLWERLQLQWHNQ